MSRYSLPAAIAVLLICPALTAGAQEAIPRFSQFDFARQRIEHKVIVDATLQNPGASDLSDVRVTVSYFDGDRELRKSKPAQVPTIPAGKAASFKIEAVQVPHFNRYVLYLETGGRKLIYVGNESFPMPSPRSLPEKLVLESCSDTRPKDPAANVALRIAVVNSGDLSAREPFALVLFQDARSAVVHRARVTLADSVKPRCRDVFEVSVPGVPAYSSVKATVSWIAAEFPSPASPQVEAGALTLTGCRIVRFTDGSARIIGKVRNGLTQEVDRASASFSLGTCAHTFALPVPLKPEEERNFEFIIPECPPFDEWAFNLAYGDADQAVPSAALAPPIAALRTESKEVPSDVGPASQPREKDPLEDPPARNNNTEKSSAIAELRGVFWVEGVLLKNKQHTGDVAFIKVAFRDGKGKPFQPVGVLSATVYIDGERRAVSRQFRKESWKVDAAKVNASTVTPDFIAHDTATGDLWVGLFRWDKTAPVARADIGIRVVDLGTWEWKGLEKDCQAAPKAPEKK